MPPQTSLPRLYRDVAAASHSCDGSPRAASPRSIEYRPPLASSAAVQIVRLLRDQRVAERVPELHVGQRHGAPVGGVARDRDPDRSLFRLRWHRCEHGRLLHVNDQHCAASVPPFETSYSHNEAEDCNGDGVATGYERRQLCIRDYACLSGPPDSNRKSWQKSSFRQEGLIS